MERRAAGQEVMERAAQTVNVGADIGAPRVADPLVGVVQFGRSANFGAKAVPHPAPVHEMAADDLENLRPPHELVRGQVHHSHPAASELAENLIVGALSQSRRQRAGRRPLIRARANVELGETGG